MRCAGQAQMPLRRQRYLGAPVTHRWLAGCLAGLAAGPSSQIKIIAAILEAPVIERILTHLGLQARAPPRASARGDLQQAA